MGGAVNQYSKGTFGGRGGGVDGNDDPIPFVLTLVPAPVVRASIDPQPLVSGNVGRRDNPNASSPSSLPKPVPAAATDTGRVTVSEVVPFASTAIADNLPFASSPCNRASSSAVSRMYDGGGRGNNGGGDRGGEICLWSREIGGWLRIGEGNNPVVDGVLGELYSSCRRGVMDGGACSSASYLALSNAFSSAALKMRRWPGCVGLGGKGGDRARRCGGSPDCVAGDAGCHGGGSPPSAVGGSEPLTSGGSVPVAV